MTAEQLINNVRRVFGNRSVSVSVIYWHHANIRTEVGIEKSYRLSIIPGLTGAKCDQFEGETLCECAEKLGESIAELVSRTVSESLTDNGSILAPGTDHTIKHDLESSPPLSDASVTPPGSVPVFKGPNLA